MEQMIYLDNAAATKLDGEVFEAMKPCYFDNYGVANSESGYLASLKARVTLASARAKIAASLGAEPEEFIFTSGNTESSNLALKGVAKTLSLRKGNHIIVSKIEDYPVLQSAQALEKQGFDVDYLDVDEYGFVKIDQMKALMRPNTILVSIQHGNQEIGTIQDIAKIGILCKARNVLFHTDATHTFTRVPLDVKRIHVDLITVSAHTIHGPKGIGGLFVRKGTPIVKIMDGGYQEFNLRAGIENIPGAVGFARAVELVTNEENNRLKVMRDQIINLVLEKIPHVTLNGHPEKRTPQNANITFHLIEGESLTLHLNMHGIVVSTGSVCFNRSMEASHVIMAIGGDHERAHLRFTLGRYNTMEEISRVVDTLAKVIGDLKKISRLKSTR
jgi:Cysteine sulfinate desulfinase/cysteine desulfurase and related enzymes